MLEKPKAILVGVNLNNQPNFTADMQELSNLAEACQIEVVGELTQNLNRVNNAHYLGSGKVEELAAVIAESQGELVIFNDELSPSQIRNLEEELPCQVKDRTSLILDIFARRAQSREAKLQVEMARLKYRLPRLTGAEEALSQQRGGVGTYTRGSGETKLETDRRAIDDRIVKLSHSLDKLAMQRQVQRKQRENNPMPLVSLVGYTNAGKSTLMNTLVSLYGSGADKQVFEKDMLFATLDTAVRSIKLPDNKSFLLTDTVGFVNKLPHHLVKAFRSTLEEVTKADLLIHVVDYANPNYQQQIKITEETLMQIGAGNIPVIYAYNKIDLVTDATPSSALDEGVYLSAKRNIGLSDLLSAVSQAVLTQYVECQMLIPYDQGEIVSYLHNNALVKESAYQEQGTLLTLACRPEDYRRYVQYVR